MRIVYCLDNLFDLGGIGRITIIKANALANREDNDVWIVVLEDTVAPQLQLNEKIHVVSLDCHYHNRGKSRLLFHLQNIVQKVFHYYKLYKSLNRIRPDVIISTGQNGVHLLQWLYVKSCPFKVREYHFVRNYMDFQCHSRISWVRNKVERLYDIVTNFYGYDKVAVLTKEDMEKNWKRNNRVIVIPNPITLIIDSVSTCDNKVALAAGRLHEQKNYASMIRIWQSVAEKHPDWELQIYGDGWLRQSLEDQIKNSRFPYSVKLMGKTDQILNKMSDASMYLMTSIFEGLPLVLIEAMSVGLPVVSFACPCGPRDIISDNIDGFLVNNQDEQEMVNKICWLIEHPVERKLMGKKALLKSKQYDLDRIIDRWMNLFTKKK